MKERMKMTNEQKNFIEKIAETAVPNSKSTKILASLSIAQAILESAWGKSGSAIKFNALYGIKAGSSWNGKSYNSKTQECYDGKTLSTITDAFRAYDNWEQSIIDYFNLLSGSQRYKNLIGEKDYKTACQKIREDGYATAPSYTTSLIKLIETYGLTKFDGTSNYYDSGTIGTVTTPAAPITTPAQSATKTIRLLQSAKYYTTGALIPDKYKNQTYTVMQTSKDGRKVLLKEIYSWVWLRDVANVL
jgi:hypothetical protein